SASPPPRPSLFPYTTLFRSASRAAPATHARHGALPWSAPARRRPFGRAKPRRRGAMRERYGRPWDFATSGLDLLQLVTGGGARRSEEHTSELQSRGHLVCRL